MFKNIKRLSESVQELTVGVTELILMLSELPQAPPTDSTSAARLEALEVRQSVWEAEMDAQLIKADSKYKSARNAEERSRTMAKQNEETGEGNDDGVAELQAAFQQLQLQSEHGEGSQENGVPPVRQNLGFGSKETAMRAKFG